MKIEQGAYEYQQSNSKLGIIKATKNRQIIGIEIIKEHLFGDKDFKTIEIVLFKSVVAKSAI